MRYRKGHKLAIAFAVVAVLATLAWFGWLQWELEFLKLVLDIGDKDHERAMVHVRRLSSSRQGVRVALRYLTIGPARDYSYCPEILINSPHREFVLDRLRTIAEEVDGNSDQRLMAQTMLFELTHNTEMLRRLLVFAEPKGGSYTRWTRYQIMSAICDVFSKADEPVESRAADLAIRIGHTPPDRDLDVDIEEACEDIRLLLSSESLGARPGRERRP